MIIQKEVLIMKLYISESIKRLRLSKGLTQEALAERLGVSFQSVSRWESGASYPDIELIPEIAAFFAVSTDVLMGVERATMEQNLVRDKKLLRNYNGELKDYLAFAESLHRKYPHDAELLVDLSNALSCFPERKSDLQRTIHDYIEHKDAEKIHIDQLIQLLIYSESRENLPKLLEKYATDIDMSRVSLLENHAYRHEDKDNGIKYRQYSTLRLITQIFVKRGFFGFYCFRYSKDAEKILRRNFQLLNMLTGFEADSIVGDGNPDLWYGNRVAWGFNLAGNMVLGGRIEEAYTVLDEVIDLCEKFYAIPEGTVLTYRCDELSELSETIRYGVRNPDDVFDFSTNLYRCMRSDEKFCGVDLMYERDAEDEEFDHHVECVIWDMRMLDWECFDCIREDERFKSYRVRLENYVHRID